jgi:predicted DNA-binding protein (UPF0251 family)
MPVYSFYRPHGVPLHQLTGVNLRVEAMEAMRLADAKGLDQAEASAAMGISRPTFSRILTEARQIVARALSNGWAIHIEGGDYRLHSPGSSRNQGER